MYYWVYSKYLNPLDQQSNYVLFHLYAQQKMRIVVEAVVYLHDSL